MSSHSKPSSQSGPPSWKSKVDKMFDRLKDMPFDRCCLFSWDARTQLDDLIDSGRDRNPSTLCEHKRVDDLCKRFNLMEARRRKLEVLSQQTSEEEEAVGEEEEEVCCTLCRDCLDEILEKKWNLHAAQCGHLFCSGCLETMKKPQNCPRCLVVMTEIRRLFLNV